FKEHECMPIISSTYERPVPHQRPDFAFHCCDDRDFVMFHHIVPDKPEGPGLPAVPIQLIRLTGLSRCGLLCPSAAKAGNLYFLTARLKVVPFLKPWKSPRSCGGGRLARHSRRIHSPGTISLRASVHHP